jgi:small subunit ribosomal protein S19
MVGHKLGEFSATRKFVRHGGKLQKETEASASAPKAAPKAAPKKPAGKK